MLSQLGISHRKRIGTPKTLAPKIVFRAIITGYLEVPTRCAYCDSPLGLVAHHEDYDKPLDILWLCRSCHRKLHNKRRKDGTKRP